jgi:hypothetical protein
VISNLQVGGHVTFPNNTGERVYMLPFLQREGLPLPLARWQPTVDQMLVGIRTDAQIYLMIDQGVVLPCQPHRRPGLHVDGNWIEPLRMHGPVPGPGPGHRHEVYAAETIILASDVGGGCRAFVGEFAGRPGPQGQCEHIDVRGCREVVFEAHRAYRGNAAMLHESLPMRSRSERTLVRLNLPSVEVGG